MVSKNLLHFFCDKDFLTPSLLGYLSQLKYQKNWDWGQTPSHLLRQCPKFYCFFFLKASLTGKYSLFLREIQFSRICSECIVRKLLYFTWLVYYLTWICSSYIPVVFVVCSNMGWIHCFIDKLILKFFSIWKN